MKRINHNSSEVLIIISIIIASLMVSSFGCAKKEGEIKIGAILPLTGDAAKYGQSAQKGMELAVNEINDRGGIDNKKIRLIIEDSQGQVKDGVATFRKLISVEKVPI